jgi:apolipoprotein N-acyltransferase
MRRIPARFVVLAVISAALQILPFPIAGPVPLWRTAFAWIALLPLLYALLGRDKEDRPLSMLQSGAIGYLCGILWYAGNCYWIYQTMYLYGGLPKPVALGILFLFALYLGLYHALFGSILGVLRRSNLTRNQILLFAPFVWVAVELARARITGFPWDLLGLTQIDNPVLSRLAPITGTYGLSFFIAFVNALWLMRIVVRERRFIRPLLTVAGIVLFLGYLFALHALPVPQQNPTTATVNLVQENLSVGAERVGPPETTQQLLDSFTNLSTHPSPAFLSGIPEISGTPEVVMLHKSGPSDLPEGEDHTQSWQPQTDLIVWPEAPSGFFTNDPDFHQRMNDVLASSSQALLIIGSIGIDPNSAPKAIVRTSNTTPLHIFTPGPVHSTHDGGVSVTTTPATTRSTSSRSASTFPSRTSSSSPASSPPEWATWIAAPFAPLSSFRGHTYATFVCYESIFGDEIRQFVKNGAEVLVNISDDGWYGDTSAAWQHLNMVRMRAIENHRWILRSTNTGVDQPPSMPLRPTATSSCTLIRSLH